MSFTLQIINNLKENMLINICSKANFPTHRSFEKYIYRIPFFFFFLNQTKWEQIKCLVKQMSEE